MLRAALKLICVAEALKFIFDADGSITPKRYTQPFFKTYPPESLEFREGLEQLPVKQVAEQTHSMGLPGFYFIWANHQL